jgi:hypothetical protein
MPTCASCGHERPDGAKFCLECGAPVASAAAPREQRKTVTVLFCDVAGSTELGESTDPEALLVDLALVLTAAGERDAALEMLSEARSSYEQKATPWGSRGSRRCVPSSSRR